MPVMIAADMVKGLIQGGGEEPPWKAGWGLSDYVWSGVERAGLFGSGQFALDALTDITQRGGSGIGALTGPTVEQLTDAVRVLGGNGQFRPFAVKSLPASRRVTVSRWTRRVRLSRPASLARRRKTTEMLE